MLHLISFGTKNQSCN